MKWGQSGLGCCVFLLSFILIGCSSKPSANKPQSVPSSAQENKDVNGKQGQPGGSDHPAQGNNHQSISYATNPERFGKVTPYEPPFNITNPKTAQEHFNVAVNYDHRSQLDKAIGEYTIALSMQPDWALAHDRLALDYQKQNRMDNAIAEWELATKYNPQFYAVYDLLAGAYERQGKIKSAIRAYSALLNYPPAQMPAHYQLGLWYAQIGDRQNAQAHLESYRELAIKTREEPQSDRFQKALQELKKLKQQG